LDGHQTGESAPPIFKNSKSNKMSTKSKIAQIASLTKILNDLRANHETYFKVEVEPKLTSIRETLLFAIKKLIGLSSVPAKFNPIYGEMQIRVSDSNLEILLPRNDSRTGFNTIEMYVNTDWNNEENVQYELSISSGRVLLNDPAGDIYDRCRYFVYDALLINSDELIRVFQVWKAAKVEILVESKAKHDQVKSMEVTIQDLQKQVDEETKKDLMNTKEEVFAADFTAYDSDYDYETKATTVVTKVTKKLMKVWYGARKHDFYNRVNSYRLISVKGTTYEVELGLLDNYGRNNEDNFQGHKEIIKLRASYFTEMVDSFYRWNTKGVQVESARNIEKAAEITAREAKGTATK
jgi:hypothetical protein